MKKLIILLFIGIFLTGLFAGFLIGQFVKFDDFSLSIENEKKATLYIGTATLNNSSISSGELSVALSLKKAYSALFEDQLVQAPIAEKFPSTDYSLSLDFTEEDSNIFYIVVRGSDDVPLADICNFAADIFCEKLPSIIEGTNIRIINYAK